MKFLFPAVGLVSALACQLAGATSLGSEARLERSVTLFQQAPAQLHDRYSGPLATPLYFTDLPASPVPGSCDAPGVDVTSIAYPSILQPKVNDEVRLYVTDSRLGSAVQSARVRWRQDQRYGLQLLSGPAKGETLPWQVGDGWARLLSAPEHRWLRLDGAPPQGSVSLRCAVMGPTWAAQYQATRDGERLTLSLDALIQIPTGQQWGRAVVGLSSQVGTSPRMMMARVSAREMEAAPALEDGQWRFQFPEPLDLSDRQLRSFRLWQTQVPITRSHDISFGINANRSSIELAAQRVWTLENTGQPWVAGQLQINGPAPDYQLEGQSSLAATPVGGRQRLGLGPSLSVHGTLIQTGLEMRGGETRSTWELSLHNSADEPATVTLRPQLGRDVQLNGVPQAPVLGAGQSQRWTLNLTEPRRR